MYDVNSEIVSNITIKNISPGRIKKLTYIIKNASKYIIDPTTGNLKNTPIAIEVHGKDKIPPIKITSYRKL